jgi:putative colanic acid biosynthesis UDP-glucose lipid carrier transferase
MASGFLRPYASRIVFLQRFLDASLIFFTYWFITINRLEVVWDSKRILATAFAVVFFAFFAELFGLYRSWRNSSLIEEIQALLKVWLLTIFVLLTLAFITKTSEMFSRSVMTIWWTFAPVTLVVMRLIVRWGLMFVRRRGANVRTVAIVGYNPVGIRLVKHLKAMSWTGLVVNGFFDHRTREFGEGVVGTLRYSISSIDELMLRAHSGEIDSVYIALPMKAELRIAELVNQLSDTTASVYVIPDLFMSELMHSRWIDFGGMPLMSVYETPFYGLYGWVKRMEDLILGGLILLLILPIMVAIAIAVKLTSPGTVIFKQRRYGLNGEVVEVWKFRSMTVCEDGDHVPQAKKCDARITPFGAFLRKTSLDELPQFINVLQGKMSIVGPRPHAVAHNEQYRKLIKGYMLRHKVKPGITGLAQVNGCRGETDTLDKMQKRVDYDLEYIQNWSLWLDLKIVFLTVWRGFGGAHAY